MGRAKEQILNKSGISLLKSVERERESPDKSFMSVKNRTLFIEDNLVVLRGMESESVDLIYLDPPFNSNKIYKAPIGSKLAGYHFKDMFTFDDLKHEWWGELSDKNTKLYEIIHAVGEVNGIMHKAYLIYMSMRIIELHRILKKEGSIYLHCDQTMSHSLKLVMDSIFKKRNIINEIIWQRQTGRKASQHEKRSYGRQIDCIFAYSKSKNDYFFKIPIIPRTEKELDKKYKKEDEFGRKYCEDNIILNKSNSRENLKYKYKGYIPTYGWMMKKSELIKMDEAGKLIWNSEGTPKRKYLRSEDKGKEVNNLWDYISKTKLEKTDYKTQKPLKLLERIIQASSREKEKVLDPFCGCTTACIASEKLNREWVGIDISPKAEELIEKKMGKKK